jgi:hypothetical protein
MATNRAKINVASKATDVVLEAHQKAARFLAGSVHYNGFGVLADVSMVQGRLFDAKSEIDKALAAIRGCKWPSNEDYGEE